MAVARGLKDQDPEVREAAVIGSEPYQLEHRWALVSPLLKDGDTMVRHTATSNLVRDFNTLDDAQKAEIEPAHRSANATDGHRRGIPFRNKRCVEKEFIYANVSTSTFTRVYRLLHRLQKAAEQWNLTVIYLNYVYVTKTYLNLNETYLNLAVTYLNLCLHYKNLP